MTPPNDRYFASERLDMLPHIPAVDSYLDVGCAEGRFAGHLKARRPGSVVWGIEPDPEAAAEAAGRIDHVVRGTFPQCLPEVDRRFACIVCNDVLEHMVDPWGACEEFAARLEPGGTLVASIPNIRNLATLSQLALKGRWDYVPAGVLDRTHLRFFTRATIIEMFEAAGFSVESVTGSWPLTTVKMRVLRAAVWCVRPGLAREGAFRQYVVVARQRAQDSAGSDAVTPFSGSSGEPAGGGTGVPPAPSPKRRYR
ncbi:MAG: class I SAM-dependent methyltransferase [Acidimicrobiia bacterium]|nr:class I SAM-dependent methyltransferase [Acidimicrobiia bacterium]